MKNRFLFSPRGGSAEFKFKFDWANRLNHSRRPEAFVFDVPRRSTLLDFYSGGLFIVFPTIARLRINSGKDRIKAAFIEWE